MQVYSEMVNTYTASLVTSNEVTREFRYEQVVTSTLYQ